ncbi:hydroxyacid dehydrogenase [Pseudomonas gingeri]|uniref:Hydroxyacid dehydrogenase n=1 Tax=Pseudomonas gingeri TaxID=117681 RepID=A0A7Y7YD62_9PSED|nr:hydroxyacid dehydrogenase [Pseudomonas gingeri]NWA01557.1 hydroxyacid dehydrogenase [Pseudomonas gingeri]NWA13640.1 hydroxyacid dehydrogenase [Pseudomonas gingeri]NWA53000.1 hydroxyacid dehydrogenase [Pseudomonas gingeri]NWA96497.1 hydroxyacid dehydrogenase [Pseudomonas gingeri]NWA99866.1 hydroxyacid dehydrogenase [Pseudomonas gingeri]
MSPVIPPARIFLAPAPRAVSDIFDQDDLAALHNLGEVCIHEDGPVTEAIFNEKVLGSTMIIGQIDLPAERLAQLPELTAIFNVEGNFLGNIDYAYCFSHGVRVLNVSPVFAEPVAEVALGMAIDLARGISRSDRRFRTHSEAYGLDANRDAYSLFRQKVGFIGMGDLGKAIVPLLKPFNCEVMAYDPWLPADYLGTLGCRAATLEQVLRESKIIFVVAGVTAQNQGFLDAGQFASMQPGASFILVSRAGVVDFDAMLDAAASGHIRVATDVFPVEPVPAEHRLRGIDNLLLSPHQAGAMDEALRQIGKRVVADAQLISRRIAPVMCKVAQPESVFLLRSKPVDKS